MYGCSGRRGGSVGPMLAWTPTVDLRFASGGHLRRDSRNRGPTCRAALIAHYALFVSLHHLIKIGAEEHLFGPALYTF